MKLIAMLDADGHVVVYFLRPTEEVTVPGMAPADMVIAHATMTRTEANNFGNALIKLGNASFQ